MATQSLESVKSVADALQIFANKIVVPDDRDFDELGAYTYPLRSQVPVVLEIYDKNGKLIEKRNLTRGKEKEIVNLYLGNEWQLFRMLEAQHKGSFEHGGIERQLQAFHSKNDQRYRQNVLDRYWVKTGEMGIRVGDGHQFYRITEVKPRQLGPAWYFDDEAQIVSPNDYSYRLGRKVEIPRETEGKLYWRKIVYEDEEGRSVVGCGSDSGGLGLDAVAVGPLYGDGVGAVGTWRKAG